MTKPSPRNEGPALSSKRRSVVHFYAEEQLVEIKKEFQGTKLPPDEQAKFEHMLKSDARLDVYHFQHVEDGQDDEELDPGSLLLVMGKLAKLCHGVSFDPQSGTLL